MGWQAKPRWWDSKQGWYVKLGGRQYRLADRPDEEARAWREFHRLERELGQGGRVEELRVDEVCFEFTVHGLRGLAPHTVDWYARHLKSFLGACGMILAADLKPLDVVRWLDRHGWSATTRRGAITAIKRAFRWARRQGLIATDPLADLEKPPAERRKHVLDARGAQAVLDAFPPGDPFRVFLEALHATGCRPGELMDLTAAGVDLEAGTWTVRNKTRHATREPTRTVYLTPAMLELSSRLAAAWPVGPIFRNQAGRPWTRFALNNRFARLRQRTGLGAEAVAYSFRHEYVTSALERGVPIATVAQLIGHTDVTMIQRVYSRLSERTEHLRSAAMAARPDGDAEPVRKTQAAKSPAPRRGARPGKRPRRSPKVG